MGLSDCAMNLNRVQKELKPHGTLDFPCAGYFYPPNMEYVIPWHWHEDMEIIYVKSGRLKLQIPAKTFHLKADDCVIINSNIPHYTTSEPYCELHSMVFDPLLITGTKDSVYAKKYISPLISNSSFSGYLITDTDCSHVINDFNIAFESLSADALDYEFIVREKLSSIALYVYHQFEQEFQEKDNELNQDNIRIRKMLDYIHQHYAEPLSLSAISRSADIGERECLRCFQRTIQVSPMQYLLKYRVMRGASLLLENPSSSISEVSAYCGFDSPSNFSKMFKRFYTCTPREYRNNAT